MSLAAIWCICTDGLWYEDPVWVGENNAWFLCLDDDDPPELVINIDVSTDCPVLDWFEPEMEKESSGFRIFNEEWHPAYYLFGKLTKVPPPPQRYHSKNEQMLGSHWYDMRKGRNNG